MITPDNVPGAADSSVAALKFFTYSAIILNLTGTFICLITIKMCTDVPHRAQQAVLLNPNSWAAKIADGTQALPPGILISHHALLEAFGMSKKYRWIDTIVFSSIIIFGFFYTIISVVLWVWLSSSYVSAGAVMITAVPAFFAAIYVLCVGVLGQGWQ